MSSISHKRCSGDMDEFEDVQIGANPSTGQPVMLGTGGVASVLAVQSAMMTLSTTLKNGHEKDFLEKIALALNKKLSGDPHALCPLLTVCSMCLLMLTKQVELTFDSENHLVIRVPAVSAAFDQTCAFNDDDDDDDNEGGKDHGTNEGTVGSEGAGEGGEGTGDDGINP